MRTRLLLLAVASLVPTAALAQGSVFPSTEQKKVARLLQPDEVSAEAHKFLKGQMKNHAKEMSQLSLATATLKYEQVKKLATGISNDPRLDPATAQASKLPKGFFDLQDYLKKRALALAEVADAKDPDSLAASYEDLVVTCMACHWAFLPPEARPVKKDEPKKEPAKAEPAKK